MLRLLISALFVLTSQASAAEPINPLHFLIADWGLDALSDSSQWSGLNYGFRQADVAADPPAIDYVLASNNCSVSTSALTEDPFDAPLMTSSAGCAPETEFPLISDEGLGIVVPGGVFGPIVVQDRIVPVDVGALGAGAYALSTSSGMYARDIAAITYERRGFFQAFAAEKSENAQFADLAGDWAFTRLEVEVSPGSNDIIYTVLTFPAAVTEADLGGFFVPEGTEFIESEFLQELDGSGVEKRRFESTFAEADAVIPWELSSDGEIFWDNGDTGQPGRDPQVFGGFVTPTSDVIVLAEGVPGIYPWRNGDEPAPDLNLFSAHQVFVGIKRNTNPKLNGRKYRLVGVKFHPKADRFELASWNESTRLHFQGKHGGTWWMDADGKTVSLGNSGQVGVTPFSQRGRFRFGYRVEGDGRIFLDLGAIDNLEEGLVNGYASTDNRMLVFSHALSLNNEENGEIGMWIGLCTNCEDDEDD
jgi:hypothetical protein